MPKDGYPTKKELQIVRRFDIIRRPIRELTEFLEHIWWASSWGFHLRKTKDEYASMISPDDKHAKYRYHYVLSLSTGGWSGNEDIIEALEQNRWFYIFYWHSSRTGGHYEFRIPEHSYNREKTK